MDLIALTDLDFNGETLPTVNGRDLHKFLQAKRDFTTWMKDRIGQYGFQNSIDYIMTFPKTGERQNVKMTEYHLTLDMAKELSMVERNAKGREARRYFIACEKRLKAEIAAPAIADDAEPATLMADDEEMRAIHKVRLAGSIFGKSAARALWFKVGLPTVPEMTGSSSFREEDDAVSIFAREGIVKVPGFRTKAADLWSAFREFCAQRNLHNNGEKSFLTRFGRMGFRKTKIYGRSVYLDLRVNI